MKKLLFLIPLLVLFLIPLTQAVRDCSPDPGYALCYTNNYGDAHAKIQASYGIGRFYTNSTSGISYAVPKEGNEIYYNLDYSGEKLYVYKGISSWNSIHCSEHGCDGEQISEGKYVLATVGQSYDKCIAFVAWDERNGDWAWVGGGWLKCGTRNVVACYKDSNCPTDYYCDKSSNWKQWKCKSTCVSNQPANTCGKDNCGETYDKCLTDYSCISNQCIKDCVSSQPANTCGKDNCGIEYDSCDVGYTCTNSQCINDETGKPSDDIWEKAKEIATNPVFPIGDFQVQVWHLTAAVVLFLWFIRK